jgi:uncharacterized caspase-like protein
VIGNSAYQQTPVLINPRNDAADVAVVLRALGFEVIECLDLDKGAFDRKIRNFSDALTGAAAGVFFYAGHGLQVNGQNFIVPIDARAETETALDFEMIRVDVVHQALDEHEGALSRRLSRQYARSQAGSRQAPDTGGTRRP